MGRAAGTTGAGDDDMGIGRAAEATGGGTDDIGTGRAAEATIGAEVAGSGGASSDPLNSITSRGGLAPLETEYSTGVARSKTTRVTPGDVSAMRMRLTSLSDNAWA